MCVTVMVRNIECKTKAELRKEIVVEPVRNTDFKIFDDDDCLCPCDLAKTAELASMKLSGDDWDRQRMTPNAGVTGSGATD